MKNCVLEEACPLIQKSCSLIRMCIISVYTFVISSFFYFSVFMHIQRKIEICKKFTLVNALV